MLESYAEFCYDQIGAFILDYIEYFEDLRPQLAKANIDASLPEYVAMMVFTTLAATFTAVVVLGSLFGIQSGVAGLFTALAVSIVIGAATLMGFYLYPSILIRNRSAKIQDRLPFATMYMSTLAGTGTDVQEIFRVMGEVDEYGEVSDEAEKISQDIETFGMDISEALQKAADRTPSKDFKELMWGMNHVITSGGSLRSFLQERAETLMNDYQRRVEEFAEQLGLLVEMYITLIIVGSIIFTSMSAVISSVAPNMDPNTIVFIQVMAIFFGLPVISGMFIILIEGMAPEGIR